jgi:phytoene dehydrogenase-like protein
MQRTPDVVVVGAGHNGLVAAILLARAKLNVLVLEQKHVVGGAVRTEFPFKCAPRLGISTGAYLLGLMPPELMTELGLRIKLRRRDPHYFLPTTDRRYLLFGSNAEATRRQMVEFFSEADHRAYVQMSQELLAFRDDLAPAWLQSPMSLEATAERFIRPHLRSQFVSLCTGSVGAYLERFEFKSDLIKAMFAVTDGFSGVYGAYDTPGTGMNFLVHNMCRLPGADGTWMVVEGGMGALAQDLQRLALEAGVTIRTQAAIKSIDVTGRSSQGVTLTTGEVVRAALVLSNADPFTTRTLVGRDRFDGAFNAKVDAMEFPGSSFKVNMALRELPQFTCLKEDRGQYGPTVHLLPDETNVMRELRQGWLDVQEGRLPQFPSIEWYLHTGVDPSLKDEKGRHNSALFVEWVPYELKGSTWSAEKDKYVKHLLAICDRFAPNTSACVEEVFPLGPKDIEEYFGIHKGHIHHVDNKLGFDRRFPYRTPVDGLWSCSAGCHPAGSVIGCAGYNAAHEILWSMGRSGAVVQVPG